MLCLNTCTGLRNILNNFEVLPFHCFRKHDIEAELSILDLKRLRVRVRESN